MVSTRNRKNVRPPRQNVYANLTACWRTRTGWMCRNTLFMTAYARDRSSRGYGAGTTIARPDSGGWSSRTRQGNHRGSSCDAGGHWSIGILLGLIGPRRTGDDRQEPAPPEPRRGEESDHGARDDEDRRPRRGHGSEDTTEPISTIKLPSAKPTGPQPGQRSGRVWPVSAGSVTMTRPPAATTVAISAFNAERPAGQRHPRDRTMQLPCGARSIDQEAPRQVGRYAQHQPDHPLGRTGRRRSPRRTASSVSSARSPATSFASAGRSQFGRGSPTV